MAQSYFIWKGIDCRAMGVKLQGPVAIVRPEERVEHITIPGRSGDMTQLEGDPEEDELIFNSYIQTVTIMVQGWSRVREVYKWLRGAGYVTFHGEPDRRQKARIIGAVTLNKHSRNLDWWVGEVQFYCQPLKEKLTDDKATLSAAGNVDAEGDVTAKPLFLVTMSSGATGFWIACGGKRLDVSGITSGVVLIDSEVQEVQYAEGMGLLTAYSEGEFPVLKPGTNALTGENWSSVVITKRERFL